AFRAIWSEIHIAGPNGEGIQVDWSFHQHGAVLYNGGYGAAFTSDCAQFIAYARGTRFAVADERLRLFENFLLDGQQWMVRGIFYDYSVIGRQIVRSNQTASGLLRVTNILAAAPGPRRAELANFYARLSGHANATSLTGNRHFWMSDFMTHHRPGYYTSARMFSTRTFNTDGYINSEGKKSHHVADGVTYIFRRGDEYKDIFPVWDWRRVPGITAEQSAAPLDPARMQSKGKTSFVGGVSDGTYGASAMHLLREPLAARKAWFYFDDEFVCLGAGISSTSENTVLTSVNQALLSGEVRVSGQAAALARGEHELPNAQWVWHDGVGYLFPRPARVHVKNEAQRGSWAEIGAGADTPVSRDVFSVWLDHGTRPSESTYEYIVVPNSTPQTLAARTKTRTNALEVVSNTPMLQAVRHRGAKVLQAVFHQAGTLAGGPGWTVAADHPCLLQLREVAGGLQVTVANPENQALPLTLQIDRALQGEGSTREPAGSRVRFELPAGAQAGSSVSRVFAISRR
ncbi:MAG: chondroitin lyase, partial [Abditibacteriota bacterium]|nr:chondroitin lyase [Abditibacteriota bacterium]